MANSLLVPLAFFCIGASTFLFFTMLDNTLVFSNIYLSCTLADSLRKSSDILAITTNHLLILSDLPQPRFYSLRHEGYWLFTWKKIERNIMPEWQRKKIMSKAARIPTYLRPLQSQTYLSHLAAEEYYIVEPDSQIYRLLRP